MSTKLMTMPEFHVSIDKYTELFTLATYRKCDHLLEGVGHPAIYEQRQWWCDGSITIETIDDPIPDWATHIIWYSN